MFAEAVDRLTGSGARAARASRFGRSASTTQPRVVRLPGKLQIIPPELKAPFLIGMYDYGE